MDIKAHWEQIYSSKESHELSWFQREPAASLNLIDRTGLGRDACVIDVGGGESCLVDALLERGLTCLTVLDISRAALNRAKARLGTRQNSVVWLEADVTGNWNATPVDLWHDRAVFHFLTEADERARYLAHLRRTVKLSGHVIMATFAPEGPPNCSGLPVRRYSGATLADELGAEFAIVDTFGQTHQTPAGRSQAFCYVWLRRA
jgi:ubiquinone/menaquinone biosynthesis C-methylase UbiE